MISVLITFYFADGSFLIVYINFDLHIVIN
jgi:hypothetical protein